MSRHLRTSRHTTFENIKQQDGSGNEFWLARQLAKVLEYSEYRHFLPVLERAKESCRHSGYALADHFEDILEMVDIGSGAKRRLPDVRLSRYASGMALILLFFIGGSIRADDSFKPNTDAICNHVVNNVLGDEWYDLSAPTKEARIDINNDGHIEILKTELLGTSGKQYSYYEGGSGKKIALNDYSDGLAINFYIIEFEKNIYILYCADGCKSAAYLGYLSELDAFHKICDFSFQVIKKPENKACNRFLEDSSNNYIIFDEKVDKSLNNKKRWGTSFNGEKSIDINSDGKNERLIKVNYSASSARGCDYNYYDLLDADGFSFDIDNQLRTALLSMQGIKFPDNDQTETQYCDGNNAAWFNVEGEMYFETISAEPYGASSFHKIFKMINNDYVQVCNFNFETRYTIKSLYKTP